MIPGSPLSVKPRWGTTTFQSLNSTAGSANQREIWAGAISGDTSYTTFIYCITRIDSGSSDTLTTEYILPAHLGQATYNYLVSNGLTLLKTFVYAVAGTYPPTGVQFGNKAFIYYPDQRPVVIMSAGSSALPVAFDCGIQPPVFQPSTANTVIPASNITHDATVASLNYIDFAYAYYSSSRNVYSQPSPLQRYVIPDPPVKVRVSGFFYPRDDYVAQQIDYVVVAARVGASAGLQVLEPQMMVPIAQTNLSGTVTMSAGAFTMSTTTDHTGDLVAGVTITLIPPIAPGIQPQSFVVKSLTTNSITTYQASSYNFTTVHFTTAPFMNFDFSPGQLDIGFDLNALSGSLYVPPSVKYSERYNEEIWLGGQRRMVSFDPTNTITVQRASLTGQLNSTAGGSVSTVAVTSGSAALTGTGTNFASFAPSGALSILQPLDTVRIAISNPDFGLSFLDLNVATVSNDTTATFATNSNVTGSALNATRIYRQNNSARCILTIAEFTTAHLYMNLYLAGKYVGRIWDVSQDGTTAWLFSDVPASISATTDFKLFGQNDSIWRTAYDSNTPGNVPTTFPECAQMDYPQLLTQMLDQGQQLMGLKATNDVLQIFFDNSIATLTGGNEVGEPLPDIRGYYGRAGAVSPRSIAKAPTGELCWIGTEGLYIDTGSGVQNISSNLNCQMLFRGGQWIARADLPTISVGYARDMNGFVFGPFTIGGVANCWGLLTFIPQVGIWLFDGQQITSNIVEYLNGDGRGVTLCGDAQGRIKWLLNDSVLNDVALTAAGSAADYLCLWQSQFESHPDGSAWAPARVKLLGLMPQIATFSLTLRLWRALYPEHDRARMLAINSASEYTVAVNQNQTLMDKGIPVSPNKTRFQSFGFEYFSSTGSYTSGLARALEMNRYVWLEAEE